MIRNQRPRGLVRPALVASSIFVASCASLATALVMTSTVSASDTGHSTAVEASGGSSTGNGDGNGSVSSVSSVTYEPLPDPDGRVSIDGGHPFGIAEDWPEVRGALTGAVEDAADESIELQICVKALDSPDGEQVCAGRARDIYAASIVKPAIAIAAMEAYDGNIHAQTSFGDTVGEITDRSIYASSNNDAWMASWLSVRGPKATQDDRAKAANAITERAGITSGFEVGDFFGFDGTGDWGMVRANAAVRYLDQLLRAVEGRPSGQRALTTEGIAGRVISGMYRQERRSKLVANLPKGSTANKTGETEIVSHDMAIVGTETGRYAIAAMSNGAGFSDSPVHEIMADAAEEVVDLLGGPRKF